MAVLRMIATMLVLAYLLCRVAHQLSGEQVWNDRAAQVLKWGVVLAMALVGVLVFRRAAIFI